MSAYSEICIRKVQVSAATELYISAVPKHPVATKSEISGLFADVVKVLDDERANILEERVFTVKEAGELILACRRKAYGGIDDGVSPSMLTGKQGRQGALSGVQVHAVAGFSKPEVIKVDNQPCGRVVKSGGLAYLTFSGISGGSGELDKQADAMLKKAESALKQFGGDFKCVPRTWMWLGDILSWYDQFNKVRNRLFTERGLIGEGSRQSMPASTGIGLGLGSRAGIGMDLTAVVGATNDKIEFLGAIGRQQCALDYGSAFSRASCVKSPAGKTVFVSGTASIDEKGVSTHIGDAKGQIEATIENVRAVLKDMNCSDSDVVSAVAYCKTPEVEGVFEEFKGRIGWPLVTAVCDICREELLFEVEATAVIGG